MKVNNNSINLDAYKNLTLNSRLKKDKSEKTNENILDNGLKSDEISISKEALKMKKLKESEEARDLSNIKEKVEAGYYLDKKIMEKSIENMLNSGLDITI